LSVTTAGVILGLAAIAHVLQRTLDELSLWLGV
jgi:hypothetical protein